MHRPRVGSDLPLTTHHARISRTMSRKIGSKMLKPSGGWRLPVYPTQDSWLMLNPKWRSLRRIWSVAQSSLGAKRFPKSPVALNVPPLPRVLALDALPGQSGRRQMRDLEQAVNFSKAVQGFLWNALNHSVQEVIYLRCPFSS